MVAIGRETNGLARVEGGSEIGRGGRNWAEVEVEELCERLETQGVPLLSCSCKVLSCCRCSLAHFANSSCALVAVSSVFSLMSSLRSSRWRAKSADCEVRRKRL